MNTFEEAIVAHEQWKTTFEQDVRTGGGGPHVDVVRATVSAAAGTLDTKGVITCRHGGVRDVRAGIEGPWATRPQRFRA